MGEDFLYQRPAHPEPAHRASPLFSVVGTMPLCFGLT
jgi:hypothetical protein